MAKMPYEKRNRIGHITLNRPDAHNALDDELNSALWTVWGDFAMNGILMQAYSRGPARPSARERPEDPYSQMGEGNDPR